MSKQNIRVLKKEKKFCLPKIRKIFFHTNKIFIIFNNLLMKLNNKSYI